MHLLSHSLVFLARSHSERPLFLKNGCSLQRVQRVVARQGGMPNHDQSMFLRLNDYGVKLPTMICYTPADLRAEAQTDARKLKMEKPIGS